MHRVIGRRMVDFSPEEYAELRKRYSAALIDVGTGDGKHVLHLARGRPDWLVVGLDASADRMRKSSTRAAASPARGGLANALFVRAAAERLPAGLVDIDEVHVLMPWGSLLRGMVGNDRDMLAGLGTITAPGATFLVTLNLHAWRPPVPEVGEVPEPDPRWATEQLAATYADAGWRLDGAEYLDEARIAALATSWTKRLNASRAQFDVLSLTGTFEPKPDR
ncbi:class I SAM-dependent methyltransferase [Streptomyces sp. B6B3]|uniref:class I SAM-dependent methyltransferase n=1 Tax=Streptomyces sp. B6B3 TaxID=3153570 RepID=UPI00325D8E02